MKLRGKIQKSLDQVGCECEEYLESHSVSQKHISIIQRAVLRLLQQLSSENWYCTKAKMQVHR